MSVAIVISALVLPADSRVDQRVPKKLLLENGAPTAADKRQISDGVEELHWVAALKPTNIGVQSFRDDVREYLEIAVLTVALRPQAKAARLTELIHRAIPYPTVLLAMEGPMVSLSLAHKRWSQGEKDRVVIEDVRRSAPFRPDAPTPQESAFLASLALSGLPAGDLYALYQGWIDRLSAMQAATITGAFAPAQSPARAAAIREGLDAHAKLQREIAALRSQATKEKQMNRRVAINLEIKRLEAQLAEAASKL
ncbi:MAG: DUF4391 domain-containing protein [Phycisphaeraceae bacterium]|nr:DUF4391 domain-containing protein [Phycisphaeraceae bacterium]